MPLHKFQSNHPTILPKPDQLFRENVTQIADVSKCIIVMTNSSAEILVGDYEICRNKIAVIAHGVIFSELVETLNYLI